MTNELSSFDEFNGISSCLDNTIRFLSQQSKKMKTPIRFLSQLSKKWKLPREQYLQIFAPDREKIIFLRNLFEKKLLDEKNPTVQNSSP
jgi:hypothetical protein